MLSRTFRCKLLWLLAPSFAAVGTCHARNVELQVERIDTALGRLDDVSLRLDWREGAMEGELELRIGALDTGAAGYRFRALRWRCPLQWTRDSGAIACEGDLRARGAGRARLAASLDAGKLDLTLRGAKGRIAVALGGAGAKGTGVIAEAVPVAWLQPLLQSIWPAGTLTAGRLDAQLVVSAEAGDQTVVRGPVALAAFGFDSADGRHAAAGLGVQGALQLGFGPASTRVAFDGALQGGEWLAGPLYVALPPSPVGVAVDARSDAAGRWRIDTLRWSDPGVFELRAQALLDPAAATPLRELQAAVELPALARAQPRYLDALLGAAGMAGSTLGGAARAEVSLREGRLASAAATLDAVEAQDGDSRFAVQGLAGRIAWTRGGAAVDSELAWRSARLYGLPLGPTQLPMQSRERSLGLRAPASLGVLGGRLTLSRLAWRPAEEASGAALDLALELQSLDLAQLSASFGWPAFRGTLSGRLPSARYADEVLTLDGGLQADLFDGRIEAAALSLERPLGVAPTLNAELKFAALDLQPLTAAFGFGEITGRLDGRVQGLRLVDWSPVAFDADFHTTPGAKGPRRISRRAVNDLSRVGGGGLAAGLQNQVLKLFETFGYARLGLKCRLADNVCAMDGLDSSGPGYVIVEGSGLPRITVIGHQRQVDWPVLVARLRAATEGQTPIVQ